MIFKILLLALFLLQTAVAETTSEDVTSALGWAIIKKDTPKAIKLIKDGADVLSYENENSIRKIVTPSVTITYIGGMENKAYPPVILAAVSGQDEIIKAIIAKDKEAIYLKDMDGNDALMWASREGHLSTVKLLLAYGFDPLYVAGQYSAYELALNKHRYEIIELFIDKLIAENKTDIFPYTIWRLARGDGNIIEKLLKLGVKDSYKGVAPRTSLMKAAEVGNLETMKLLIKYGSDPYESNEGSLRNGYNPFTSAITSGQDEVVKCLLENYDYDLSKKFDGENYLHLVVDSYIKLDNDLFLLLIKKGKLDINGLNKYGESLLKKVIDAQTRVVHKGNLEDIEFLLSLGFNETVLANGFETAKKYVERYTLEEKENGYDYENRLEHARKIYGFVEKKINDK